MWVSKERQIISVILASKRELPGLFGASFSRPSYGRVYVSTFLVKKKKK